MMSLPAIITMRTMRIVFMELYFMWTLMGMVWAWQASQEHTATNPMDTSRITWIIAKIYWHATTMMKTIQSALSLRCGISISMVMD